MEGSLHKARTETRPLHVFPESVAWTTAQPITEITDKDTILLVHNTKKQTGLVQFKKGQNSESRPTPQVKTQKKCAEPR